MDVKIHLHRDKDDEFDAKVVGSCGINDWLDFNVPGGKVEFFIPHARTVEVAESLLRAGMDLLQYARKRRENEAKECPTTPASSS